MEENEEHQAGQVKDEAQKFRTTDDLILVGGVSQREPGYRFNPYSEISGRRERGDAARGRRGEL